MENFENEVRNRYYRNDLDQTYKNLVELIGISARFKEEGYDRMICMIDLRNRTPGEIKRLTEYLIEARAKMEKEYGRADIYSQNYIQDYATNINGYYDAVKTAFEKSRSHVSPFKTLMQKGRYGNYPTPIECEIHNIQPKELIESSVMGNAPFEYAMFPLEEQPKEVQQLYDQLKLFFEEMEKCLTLCLNMIEQENFVKGSPAESYERLECQRKKDWVKQKDTVYLITESTINYLKENNPLYKDRLNYASERDFAPYGYHKYNKTVKEHCDLIDLYDSQKKGLGTASELILWDNQYEVIQKVRIVVKEFDNLLPPSFAPRDMGRYMYYFCHWALSSNIKGACLYFAENYHGMYSNRIVKYGSVNSHASKFKEEFIDYRQFVDRINYLTIGLCKKDWAKEFEIALA